MICEIDGRLLVGMQFGVLVEVLCESAGATGHAIWAAGGGAVLQE